MKNKTSKLFIAFSMFGLLLTGCSNLLPQRPTSKGSSNNVEESQNIDDFEAKTREIYNLYLAQGGTLTYEQWLESIRGEDGKDGQTPHIGTNGNWWIGNKDTGVKAEGKDGKDGSQGPAGQNGADGKDGVDGKDGQTPYIGENGNWWIGDQDTGVLAKGTNGENGKGIASISYNGENELIVTFDDGSFVNLGAVSASTHKHTYECETLEATCTTDGYYKFTCTTCGHIETVINKAQGHLFDAYREKVPATCTNEGVKSRKCTVCGYEETVAIPAHDHTYSKNCVYDANKHWHYCTTCGVVKDEADHTFVDNKCSICSYVKSASSASTTGLLFGLNDDGVSYSLISYGTCTDTAIDIPSSYNGYPVTAIASGAFQNTNITSITIPNTITRIGSKAFFGCKSLTSVSLPNSLKTLYDSCFGECSSLTDIVIPNSITTIPINTFSSCRKLSNVVIPDSIESIGDGAFYNCSSLTNIVIPSSVRYIYGWAFQDCYSLANVILNEGLKSLYNGVFYNCSSLTNIIIPSSVCSIGSDCFSYSSIASVYFEQPNGWYKTSDNENIYKEVLEVPELAANQLKNMNSSWQCKLVADKIQKSNNYISVAVGETASVGITLSPNTAIDPISFISQNPEVATVDENGIVTGVSAGITTVVANASGLTISVDIRVGTPEISDYLAFYKISETEYAVAANDNYSISGDVVIPSTYNGKNVTKILSYGFSSCRNIRSIFVPSSVVSIEDSAFTNCYNLKQAKFESTVPPQIGYNVFGGTWSYNDFIILVPSSSVSAYKAISEEYWQKNAISHINGYEPEN